MDERKSEGVLIGSGENDEEQQEGVISSNVPLLKRTEASLPSRSDLVGADQAEYL